MSNRLRLLPVLMLSAALLLGLKVMGLDDSLNALSGFALAYAEESGAMEKEAMAGKGEGEAMEGGVMESGAMEAGGEMAKDSMAGDAMQVTTPQGDVMNPAAEFTPSKLQVLKNLSERRKELEERARELDMRERLISAAEKRVGERFKELEAVEEKIAAHLGKKDDETKMRVEGLVKMYSAMKPKDAARIFERLDMDVLLQLANMMNERKMAAIMAEMDPVTAQELTVEIALPKPLPAELQEMAAQFEKTAPMMEAEMEDGEGKRAAN